MPAVRLYNFPKSGMCAKNAEIVLAVVAIGWENRYPCAIVRNIDGAVTLRRIVDFRIYRLPNRRSDIEVQFEGKDFVPLAGKMFVMHLTDY